MSSDTIARLQKLLHEEELRTASKLIGRSEESVRIILLTRSCYEALNHGAGKSGLTRTVLSKVRVQIERFLSGEELIAYEDVKPLKPLANGVWELRFLFTPNPRLIGFFLQKDVFVGVKFGEHAEFDQVDERTGNTGFDLECQKALALQKQLLEGAEIVKSGSVEDAVSKAVKGGM